MHPLHCFFKMRKLKRNFTHLMNLDCVKQYLFLLNTIRTHISLVVLLVMVDCIIESVCFQTKRVFRKKDSASVGGVHDVTVFPRVSAPKRRNLSNLPMCHGKCQCRRGNNSIEYPLTGDIQIYPEKGTVVFFLRVYMSGPSLSSTLQKSMPPSLVWMKPR